MELEFGLRALRRRWAASAAIVTAIGLSAAVTAALFAVVDGLVFRPLPFPAPDQLVAIGFHSTPSGRPPVLSYMPEFAAKRDALRVELEHSPLVSDVTQTSPWQFFDTYSSRDAGLETAGVDARFFRVFGLEPAVGRQFILDDERDPAAKDLDSELPLPVVLGDALARRLFGKPAAALGVHDLAGRHARVVGVMAAGVKFPGETNVWAPVPSDRNRPPSYARLRPHATVAQLAGAFPDLEIKPLRDAVRIGNPHALEVLFAASVLLLLLTWAQVGALTLSTSLADARQLGVMLALGASRTRLARQAAAQNATLVAAAFVLAWVLVPYASAFVVKAMPMALNRGQYLRPDVRTLIFGGVMAIGCFAVLTIVPTFFVTRAQPLGVLNGRIGDRAGSVERWRRSLLAVQMAATAFLLYLSALTVHAFVQATTFDYGFDSENLLWFTPPINWAPRNATADQSMAAFRSFNDTIDATMTMLDATKGVNGTAGFYRGPLGIGSDVRPWETRVPVTSFDGHPRRDVMVSFDDVTRNFARTLRVRLLAGHDFESGDAKTTKQVLVNRLLAEQLVGMGSAEGPAWTSVIGRDLRTEAGGGRVVGVIDNLVLGPPDSPPGPEVFELGHAVAAVAIRAPASSLPAVRSTVERIWGPVSPSLLESMNDIWSRVMTPYTGQALLLGLIAAAGIPIAAIGLIGALLDAVRVRTQEIAVRLVVGATRADIGKAVLQQALGSISVGLCFGAAAGAGVGMIIRSQLFHVQAVDPLTVLAVILAIVAMAGVAAIIAALRASRIDPSVLLRSA